MTHNQYFNDSEIVNFTTQYPGMAGIERKLPQCGELEELLCTQLNNFLEMNRATSRSTIEVDLTTRKDASWLWACLAFFTPLCIFGIIANITTIVMFAKFIKRTTTSIFIIALAAVDLLMCIVPIPIWIYKLFNYKLESDLACKLQMGVSFLAIPMSGCILLIIAIDRFLLIFLVKTNVMTQLRAKIILAVMAVVCLGFATPPTLGFSTIFKVHAERFCDGELFCNAKRCRYSDVVIPQATTETFFDINVYILLAMIILYAVLYTLIFAKVYMMHNKMSKWKSSASGHGNRKSVQRKKEIEEDHLTFASADEHHGNSTHVSNGEKHNENANLVNSRSPQKQLPSSKSKKKLPHLHTALTLFMVTITYVAAYSPLIIRHFIHLTRSSEAETEKGLLNEPNLDRNSAKFFFWHWFFLNHITNPIIYSFMNPRFKEALKSLCSRCKKKNRS